MIFSRSLILFCASFLVLAALSTNAMASQAPSPQQILNQYVSDLQMNPNDYALRESVENRRLPE
jgi:hypothetical protein